MSSSNDNKKKNVPRGEIDPSNVIVDGTGRKRTRTVTYVEKPPEDDKQIRAKLCLVTPSHVLPPPPPPPSRWGLASRVDREDCPGCAKLMAKGAKCDRCKDARVHNPKALEGSRSVVANAAEMVVDANPGLGSGAAAPPNINPFGSFGAVITALGLRAVEAVSGLQANLRDSALALQTALDARLSDSDVKALDDVSGGSDSDDSQPNLDSDEEEHQKLDDLYGGQYSMPEHDLVVIKAKIDAYEGFAMFSTLTAEQRDELIRLKDLYEVGKASRDFVVPDGSPRLKEKVSKADWDKNGPMSRTMKRGEGGAKVVSRPSKNPEKNLPVSRSLGHRGAESPPPRHKNPFKVPERLRATLTTDGPAESTWINTHTPLHRKDPKKWVLTVSEKGKFEKQDDFEVRCDNLPQEWQLQVVDGVGATWVCNQELRLIIDEITNVVTDVSKNTVITQEEIDSMKKRLQAVGIKVSGGVIGVPKGSKGPKEIPDLTLRIPVPPTGFYMIHYDLPRDEDADDAQSEDLKIRLSLFVSTIINEVVWIREAEDGGTEHDSDSGYQSSVYSRKAASSRSDGSADGDVSDIDAWDHSDSEYEFQNYDHFIPGTDPPVHINADGYDAAGNYYPGALGWHAAPNNGAAAQGGNVFPQGNDAAGDLAPDGPSFE